MWDDLTPRERAVVVELARDGQTNAVIGARLCVQPKTVKFHIMNAMVKSGTSTRTALVLWWIRCGQYQDTHAKAA